MVAFYKEVSFKETRIGRIPADWDIKRLREILRDDGIYYGLTAKAVKKETKLRMLRTTDIKNYNVDWEALPSCEITEKRTALSKYFPRNGDLIVARAGTTGISVLVDRNLDNTIFGSYLIKIGLKSNAYPKFVHYYFQSEFYWKHITSGKAGSTLKNINLPILKSLEIPLPRLTEQQKIAEILSTVDEAIQKTREVIAKTGRLKKGLMQELLTKGIGYKEFKDSEIGRIPKEWEVVRIGSLGEVVTGTTPSTSVKEYWDGEFPFVTPTDFAEGKYVYETARKVTQKGINRARLIPKDSVLAVCIGSTIGKMSLAFKDCITNQQINTIICNSEISPHYVYYALLSKRSILRGQAGITAKPIVKKSMFEKFLLPLPPPAEQRQIADILSAVDEKLEIERSEKAQLERIKQGLMDLLLTGRIRVKVN